MVRALEQIRLRTESSFNLCFFRFISCGLYALMNLLVYDSWRIEVFTDILGGHFGLLTAAVYSIFVYSFTLVLFLASLGVKPRLTLLLSTILCFVVEYPISITLKIHITQQIFFVLLLLAICPNVTAFSWRDRFCRDLETYPKVSHWYYSLLLLPIGLTYFNAFLAKMINSGWLWINGETFQLWLYQRFLRNGNEWSKILALDPLYFRSLAIITLMVESCFWMVIILPKIRPWIAILGIGFHLGIYITTNISFLGPFLLSYLALFNWSRFLRVGTSARV